MATKCKYCLRELNLLGNCPKPCRGGALLIKKKELEEKIAKMKEEKEAEKEAEKETKEE